MESGRNKGGTVKYWFLMVWLWDLFAVLLIIVLQNLKTIEVVYFVHTMNQYMVKMPYV